MCEVISVDFKEKVVISRRDSESPFDPATDEHIIKLKSILDNISVGVVRSGLDHRKIGIMFADPTSPAICFDHLHLQEEELVDTLAFILQQYQQNQQSQE